VEYAQPLERHFPWRTATIAGALFLAVAATLWSVLTLAHRPVRTRPVLDSGGVPKRQVLGPVRARAKTSVLVLNGNGIANAAGNEAARLLASGYRNAVPADAPSLTYARSLVLFRPGWKPEAERLAHDARIATAAPLDGRVASAYARVPLVLILGR
jgi:hypothetical protein